MSRIVAPARALRGALIAAVAAGSASGGPAEAPPAGFAGDRFVDSRGCHFQRAEVGGQRVWAAVLDADRQQFCDATDRDAREAPDAEAGAGSSERPDAEGAAARSAAARDTPPLPLAVAADPEAAPTAAAGQPPSAPDAARPPAAGRQPGAFVQIGAYGSRARAVAVAELAREAGFPAAAHGGRGGLHLVRLGPFRDERQLRYALAWARAAGFRDAFRTP